MRTFYVLFNDYILPLLARRKHGERVVGVLVV